MANKIPNLWPMETVSVETVSPLAILRVQAENLTRMTHGLLRGEVTTTESQQTIRHFFYIDAPTLNGYRHHILTIKHNKDLFYPVVLATNETEENDEMDTTTFSAYSEVEFIKMLSGALQSGYVLSVINSLIARSNEARPDSKALTTKKLQPA